MTESATEASTAPEQAAKHHEAGLALARERRFDEAVGQFQAAIKADPSRPDAHRHLAQACADAGRLGEAEDAWLNYLTCCPDSAECHRHLGNVRKRLERLDLAIESLQKAIALDANPPVFHVDLGIVLAQAKRYPEAKQAFLQALKLEPEHFDALINLGMLLQEMGEGKEALVHLHKAVELRPDDPSGQNNLGVALSEQGMFAEAIPCYEKLLAKTPDYVLAWNNYGNALRSSGRLQDAANALQRALEHKPDYAEAYNNLGIICAQMERFAEAVKAYDQAILLRPDYPEAHANRGLVYLLLGNFQQGWADYEWRWQGGHGLKRRNYPCKQWDGSPLAGKRILLYYEQGLGDTFQFIRYATDLKARGATVVFECQPHMRQILSRTPGIDEFVIRGEKPPACDFYAPLLSLPGLCQTNLDNLPRRVPYISPDAAMNWDWKQRMARIEGFRIGIVWQGNPQHKGDRTRSIPLKCFAPLAAVPGATLITLQKNFGVDQIEKLDGLFELTDLQGIAEDGDGWLRTAAIISNLDLVVSADTSVAHLAGAMGIPVWMAIPTSPDWRWLLGREDTPWYPTMRIFRQQTSGDWDDVFGRIAEAVRERLALGSKGMREPASDLDQQEVRSLVKKADEHLRRDELPQAQGLLEQAVKLEPNNAGAHQDLGVAYAKQGRLKDGIACFRRALELSPEAPGLYGNLGLACYQIGQIEEAIFHLRKAIWLGAGSPDTHKNLAMALTALPDPAAAEESYWAALRLKPDDAEAHYQLARVQLMQGKFEQGWLEYEWRWLWHGKPKRQMNRPRWSGQSLSGKRLLIQAENDARDTIQLARYAHVLSEQGAHVAMECAPALAQLMKGCLGIEHVVAAGDHLPNHDFQVALLSLPATMGTTLQTVPAARPYLGVNTAAAELWRQRLCAVPGIRVGIAWQAETDSGKPDRRNSIPPSCIQRLARLPGVSLVNLQPAPLGSLPPGVLSLPDLGPLPDAPSDRWEASAAAVHELDLVVAADNSLAHIAGAMGIPIWLTLPISPDPRWLLGRDDSPWYPTMRLFRQRIRGDWEEVAIRFSSAMESRAMTR